MLSLLILFHITTASAHNTCEEKLWAQSVMPKRDTPVTTLAPAQALELSGKLVANILAAAAFAKQDRWDRAFDLLDEPSIFYGSGLSLTPVKDRHVFYYTPTSNEDLQQALMVEFRKHPSVQPMVSPFQQKIFSWMVIPVEDKPPFWVWKILWKDRILELTEEIGHAAQMFSEHGGGPWNLSRYYSVPQHQKELYQSVGACPGENHRTPFIEADIYAFILEVFGADFVPKSYMSAFQEYRQFADRDFCKD